MGRDQAWGHADQQCTCYVTVLMYLPWLQMEQRTAKGCARTIELLWRLMHIITSYVQS